MKQLNNQTSAVIDVEQVDSYTAAVYNGTIFEQDIKSIDRNAESLNICV